MVACCDRSPPVFLVYFSGVWDVHCMWKTGLLLYGSSAKCHVSGIAGIPVKVGSFPVPTFLWLNGSQVGVELL